MWRGAPDAAPSAGPDGRAPDGPAGRPRPLAGAAAPSRKPVWKRARRQWRRVARAVPGLLRDLPRAIASFEARNEYVTGELTRAAWPLLTQVGRAYRLTVGRRPTVVAVIGSLGKTTAARAATLVLTGRLTARTYLTDNCYSTVPLNLLRGGPLARYVVVEVGLGGRGEMGRYAKALRPDVVIVTSLGTEHVDSFGGVERLRREKAIMVQALRDGGTAVLNGDDPRVRDMAAGTAARVITFGFEAKNDVVAENLALDWPRGASFVLRAGGRSRLVRSRLVGKPMIACLLAAATAGVAAGMTLAEVASRLEALPPTPGRMQPLALPGGAVLLCDEFKSTVESVHAALDALAEVPASRRIAVMGDLTHPPRPERPHYKVVGQHLAEVADRVLFVGRRQRDYRPGYRGRLAADAAAQVRTSHEAARLLSLDLRPGDVVLVKGATKQKLTRVALALAGEDVRCRLEPCPLTQVYCEACPLLRRGP